MKLKQIYFLGALLLLLYAASGSVWAQVSATARIDQQQIEIGDQFHLFLEVSVPKGSGRLIWPTSPDLQGLEWIDSGRVDSFRDGKMLIYKQKLTLSGFDSGQYIIPAVAFQWIDPAGNAQTTATDTLLINVKPIAVDVNGDIKPIKEFEMERHWWDYWPQIIAVVVGLAVLFFLGRWLLRILKRKKSVPKREETAEQRAMRLLAALRQKSFDSDDDEKQYYSELTQIVKEFIDARFHVAFAEMTTDEMLRTAKKNAALRPFRSELKHIFSTADLAKFAKAKPAAEQRDICWNAAKLIIEKSKTGQVEGFIN